MTRMKRSMRVRKKRKMLMISLRLSKAKRDCRKLKNSFQRHSLCQKKRFNNNSKLKLHKLKKRKNQKLSSDDLKLMVQKTFFCSNGIKNTNFNQVRRVFVSYRRRSNKFLLICNESCNPDNKNDSVIVRIRLKIWCEQKILLRL